MKRLVLLLVAATTAGCTSTKTLYTLSLGDGWAAYGSSCTGPLPFYERKVDSGVLVQLMPARDMEGTSLSVRFDIELARSVRLAEPTIRVTAEGNIAQVQSMPPFVSGLKSPHGATLLDSKTFPASSTLVGEGRFSTVRGYEKSGDKFTAVVKVADRPVESFRVQFPGIVVNGREVSLPEVSFSYTEVRFVQCLQ